MRVLCETIDDFRTGILEHLKEYNELIEIHQKKQSLEVLCLGLKVASIRQQADHSFSIKIYKNIIHNQNPNIPKISKKFDSNLIGAISNHISDECKLISENRGSYRAHEKWLQSLIAQKMNNFITGENFLGLKLLRSELPVPASEVSTWTKKSRNAHYYIDILGFEPLTRGLVIIEVKRGEILTSKEKFQKLHEQCNIYYNWVKRNINKFDNERTIINDEIDPFVYIIIGRPPISPKNVVGKYSERTLKNNALFFERSFKEFLNGLNDEKIKKIFLINNDWRTIGIKDVECIERSTDKFF